MDNISNEIRAYLKRLCPYVGPNIPNSVREKARDFWSAPGDPDSNTGWQWDDGSGFYQCELELCDLDNDWTIDPVGYVAIRPLTQGKFALVLDSCLSSADEIAAQGPSSAYRRRRTETGNEPRHPDPSTDARR